MFVCVTHVFVIVDWMVFLVSSSWLFGLILAKIQYCLADVLTYDDSYSSGVIVSSWIVCCSFCILPDPVHLISGKPRIYIIMYSASLVALSNFPVAYKLLTFQVTILRGCLLVFKHPTSVCSLRDRFELHPSLRLCTILKLPPLPCRFE